MNYSNYPGEMAKKYRCLAKRKASHRCRSAIFDEKLTRHPAFEKSRKRSRRKKNYRSTSLLPYSGSLNPVMRLRKSRRTISISQKQKAWPKNSEKCSAKG